MMAEMMVKMMEKRRNLHHFQLKSDSFLNIIIL